MSKKELRKTIDFLEICSKETAHLETIYIDNVPFETLESAVIHILRSMDINEAEILCKYINIINHKNIELVNKAHTKQWDITITHPEKTKLGTKIIVETVVFTGTKNELDRFLSKYTGLAGGCCVKPHKEKL